VPSGYSLVLFNNNLSGPLPTEIGLLKKMKDLDLAMNGISGELPSELSELQDLRRLTIHNVNGNLSGKLPAFENFPELEDLSFENNNLSGSIPPSFLQGIRDKSKFLYINIAHNRLTGIIPSELVAFEALDIMLEGNKISGIDTDLCSKSEWMDGAVGKLKNSCDAILCPKGTFNMFGKLGITSGASCIECSTSLYFGSVTCKGHKTNEEKSILDNLFRATGGHQWRRKGNWTKVGVPICHREGIVCNGKNADSGVTEIELMKNNLKGEIPAEVFTLPYIKLLSFTDNQVQLSFTRISEAKKLVTLKISNADMRSMDGIGLASKTLSELHLAGNQFKGTIPTEIFKLSNLKQLFLSYNLFVGSIPSEIGMLTKIQDLDLHGNFFTGFIPTELGSLRQITALDMSKNILSGNLPLQLNDLSLLQSISLNSQKSDKKLSGSLLSFGNTSILAKLDLSDNDLSGIIPEDFLASCPDNGSTINVNLRHNRISGSLPSSLERFNFLNVDLAENELISLSNNFCQKTNWMDGKVSSFGCDAILCQPGYFAPDGKKTSKEHVCQQCPQNQDAPFYGSKECSSFGSNDESERDILVKLYDDLNGTNWIDQTNWNSDQSHCTWFGIVCNEKGFISEISLESNGLETDLDISSLLFNLQSLEKLNLKGEFGCFLALSDYRISKLNHYSLNFFRKSCPFALERNPKKFKVELFDLILNRALVCKRHFKC
jgi:Leucine-rich repeat (LRR) protein